MIPSDAYICKLITDIIKKTERKTLGWNISVHATTKLVYYSYSDADHYFRFSIWQKEITRPRWKWFPIVWDTVLHYDLKLELVKNGDSFLISKDNSMLKALLHCIMESAYVMTQPKILLNGVDLTKH